MRMLRHHVVDFTVTGKVVINADRRSNPRNRGSADKSALWSMLLGNFRPYSSRVVAMAVAVIHGWYSFSFTVATF